MKKKIISSVLLAAMVTGMLAGCGSSAETGDTSVSTDNDKATIRFAWWGSQDRADKTNEAVKLFMEENPDINVETSFYPFDSYYENLSVSATSGNTPDVFQGYVGEGDCMQYLSEGIMEPLDDYIADGTIDTSEIADNIINTGIYEGKTYGLALGVNVKCMIVDPDAYEKAGLTIPEVAYDSWEDLGQDLAKLKEVTGKYGADDPFNYNFALEYACRQNGEQLWSSTKDASIDFSEKTYSDFYNMRMEWIDQGLIPPYDVTQAANGMEDTQFAKGNAAVRDGYSSDYPTMAAATGKELKMILMPGPNTDEATEMRAGMHVCMSSSSKNKEAAARLINFLINDVDANKILNAERGMPASNKVREELMGSFDDNQKKMAEIVDLAEEHSKAEHSMAKGNTNELNTMLEDLDQEILYKALTPEEAYQQLVDASGN